MREEVETTTERRNQRKKLQLPFRDAHAEVKRASLVDRALGPLSEDSQISELEGKRKRRESGATVRKKGAGNVEEENRKHETDASLSLLLTLNCALSSPIPSPTGQTATPGGGSEDRSLSSRAMRLARRDIRLR